MFTGKRASYTHDLKFHTMVCNIDKEAGSFTCVIWDGFLAEYSKNVSSALVGTFRRGNSRIEVLVYGGVLPRQTIINLLSAWLGGKWVRMTLQQLTEGATIPKHRI